MLLPSICHFAHRKTSALLISAILIQYLYLSFIKTGLVQTNGNGS
jgi:predicted Kef-type K+ transport protein